MFLCRSGARSNAAAEAATRAGWKEAYNILEGFEGDKDAGPAPQSASAAGARPACPGRRASAVEGHHLGRVLDVLSGAAPRVRTLERHQRHHAVGRVAGKRTGDHRGPAEPRRGRRRRHSFQRRPDRADGRRPHRRAGSDVDLATAALWRGGAGGHAQTRHQYGRDFKQTLMNAKVVAVPASTSGIYLTDELFPRLGITPNTRVMPRGSQPACARRIRRGRHRHPADQRTRATSPGLDYLGPITDELSAHPDVLRRDRRRFVRN